MNSKGQGNFLNAAFFLVIGLIIITALLPIINDLVSSIQGTNVSNLSFSSTIFLLVGISGILLVLGFILNTVNSFTQPQQQQY